MLKLNQTTYLIVRNIRLGKPEALQHALTLTDALNLLSIYDASITDIIEVIPKSSVKLIRVSNTILKSLSDCGVTVRLV